VDSKKKRSRCSSLVGGADGDGRMMLVEGAMRRHRREAARCGGRGGGGVAREVHKEGDCHGGGRRRWWRGYLSTTVSKKACRWALERRAREAADGGTMGGDTIGEGRRRLAWRGRRGDERGRGRADGVDSQKRADGADSPKAEPGEAGYPLAALI
jgi:hypothetical protein